MFTTTARNWLTVLKTRFAVDARLKPTTAGRRKPRFRTAPAELLEQRQMLAGVVAASSTFDFNLFA